MEQERRNQIIQHEIFGLPLEPIIEGFKAEDEARINKERNTLLEVIHSQLVGLQEKAAAGTKLEIVSKSPLPRYTESEWARIYEERMRRKRQREVEGIFTKELKNPEFERHLFVSDFQIPDQDEKAVDLVFRFMKDFAPDHIHIVGDLLNFTPFSRYDQLAGRQPPPIKEELEQGRALLGRLVREARKVNPDAEITWYEGNHEARLFKYLVRQGASTLLDLEMDGEQVLSIPHLFDLKKLGIEWVPEMEDKKIHGARVEHGFIARSKAGYTAHGMLERRGTSGFSGHTHRQAIVWKTYAERSEFWVEIGSLCNQDPTPQYSHHPDWVQGIAVGIYDRKGKQMHPAVIPIVKHQMMFGGKIYRA